MMIGLFVLYGCYCSIKYMGGYSDFVVGCLIFGFVDFWKIMIYY